MLAGNALLASLHGESDAEEGRYFNRARQPALGGPRAGLERLRPHDRRGRGRRQAHACHEKKGGGPCSACFQRALHQQPWRSMAAASSSSYAGPPIQSMVAATPLSAGAWARWAPTVAWWRSSCTPTTPVFSPMHLRREDGE